MVSGSTRRAGSNLNISHLKSHRSVPGTVTFAFGTWGGLLVNGPFFVAHEDSSFGFTGGSQKRRVQYRCGGYEQSERSDSCGDDPGRSSLSLS